MRYTRKRFSCKCQNRFAYLLPLPEKILAIRASTFKEIEPFFCGNWSQIYSYFLLIAEYLNNQFRIQLFYIYISNYYDESYLIFGYTMIKPTEIIQFKHWLITSKALIQILSLNLWKLSVSINKFRDSGIAGGFSLI